MPCLLDEFLDVLRSYAEKFGVKFFLFCLVGFGVYVWLLYVLFGIELRGLAIFPVYSLHFIIILIL